MNNYTTEFYNWLDREASRDPEIIMTCIYKWLKPRSVVDFGSGEGHWLNAVRQLDESIDILGLDGEWVDKSRLRIPEESFQVADLSRPVHLDAKFDLAVSTEVAEHIDEEYSEIFVDSLTHTSDHILFSAAIPGQGGVHHVNEQWQNYWIQKFTKRGYFVDFSVRNYFWDNCEINEWRRQNLLFFSKDKISIAPSKVLCDVVHPESYKKLKESQEQLISCIVNPKVYNKLDTAISEVVHDYENIAIYPYGYNGRMCKAILNHKYGKAEFAIIDNMLSMEDQNIISAKNLWGGVKESFIVIDTCSNPDIHEDVLNELRQFVEDENIYIVFE